MGLRDTFKNAANTVFTAFGDIPRSCTYVSTGTKELNTHTGNVVTKASDPDVSYTGVNIIFTKYTKAEIDDVHILFSNVKGLVPVENLTPTPKKNDTITDAAGEQWGVIDWKKDPADALWILQLEQIG
ncbi:MAG: hypothetical protein GY861_19070 [bacterium]|nr:hypothetical protein [bacterium]